MANEGKAEKRRENSNTEILKTGEQPFRPSLAASLIIVGYLIISMAAAIFYLDQKLHVTPREKLLDELKANAKK